MATTNWTITGVDENNNSYTYSGTHTADDTTNEAYVWVWVLIIGVVLIGGIIGGLIMTGTIHCCKSMNVNDSGAFGTGSVPNNATPETAKRKDREFEKYIQDRI